MGYEGRVVGWLVGVLVWSCEGGWVVMRVMTLRRMVRVAGGGEVAVLGGAARVVSCGVGRVVGWAWGGCVGVMVVWLVRVGGGGWCCGALSLRVMV